MSASSFEQLFGERRGALAGGDARERNLRALRDVGARASALSYTKRSCFAYGRVIMRSRHLAPGEDYALTVDGFCGEESELPDSGWAFALDDPEAAVLVLGAPGHQRPARTALAFSESLHAQRLYWDLNAFTPPSALYSFDHQSILVRASLQINSFTATSPLNPLPAPEYSAGQAKQYALNDSNGFSGEHYLSLRARRKHLRYDPLLPNEDTPSPGNWTSCEAASPGAVAFWCITRKRS